MLNCSVFHVPLAGRVVSRPPEGNVHKCSQPRASLQRTNLEPWPRAGELPRACIRVRVREHSTERAAARPAQRVCDFRCSHPHPFLHRVSVCPSLYACVYVVSVCFVCMSSRGDAAAVWVEGRSVQWISRYAQR